MIKRAGTLREIEDFRSAQICMIIANAHRDPKKKKKGYTVKDFMPGHAKKKNENKGKKSFNFFESVIVPTVNSRFSGDKK